MSIAVIYSRAQDGIHAPLVTVEVHLSRGLPSFSIVGLPETTVKESKERVRSALLNNRFEFPLSRITTNLAPADLPKEGGRFDLPIALGILVASGQISDRAIGDYEFIGELSLTGELRAINGALPVAMALKQTARHLILPEQNAAEAALVEQAVCLPARHLLDVCQHLNRAAPLAPYQNPGAQGEHDYDVDLMDIYGHEQAKRALEIAAAGAHNLLMIGPPGSGKTMLAERLPTIMPPMTEAQALENAAIASISRHGFSARHWRRRILRAPHHSASAVALVGGGSHPKPGEISLAHHGILFLDEFPEFDRNVLEVLREPLESGRIVISRAARQVEYPARFQLLAAMNPCPCGYLGDPDGRCRCTEEQVHRYQAKLSGPLLDRIDMIINVNSLPAAIIDQRHDPAAEASARVQARVIKAFDTQLQRHDKPNAGLNGRELDRFCALDEQNKSLLRRATNKLGLTGRGIHRIVRVARTIADLAGQARIQVPHLSEAINYRRAIHAPGRRSAPGARHRPPA